MVSLFFLFEEYPVTDSDSDPVRIVTYVSCRLRCAVAADPDSNLTPNLYLHPDPDPDPNPNKDPDPDPVVSLLSLFEEYLM